MRHSILILGGTAESRALAGRLAKDPRVVTELSLAGRTRNPAEQPVPVRIGGFGGVDGLVEYLTGRGISILIDATHPYAAQMSRHAAEAAERTRVPLLSLRRSPWSRQPGDRWTEVDSVAAAVDAVGADRRRVFLTLGRQELLPFEAAPQHDYLIRSVDPVEPPLTVPHAHYVTSRGPFAQADEVRLLTKHGIKVIVAKNSGGPASYGKIAAARALGIEVVLIRRPALPLLPCAETVDDLLVLLEQRLAHAPPASGSDFSLK